MKKCKLYTKTGVTPMMPWSQGVDMQGVSISDKDLATGSPKQGDMIAVNSSNPNDRWLVSLEYFQEHYVPADAPQPSPGSFGWAIAALERGERVCRSGWNGKGMFLFLVPGSTFKVNRPPLNVIYKESTEVSYHPHIDMKTADGTIVPWLASQTDMLAQDWEIAL